MSERIAEVVNVTMEKHPEADTLSIVRVGGFTVCVRTEDWVGKTTGVYIQPETICDSSRPEFAFLDPSGKKVKVKVKKLRGIYSQGLLIPTPAQANVGDNLWDVLGLEHYEPEVEEASTRGNWEKAPAIWGDLSKYDIENARNDKYRKMFVDGETVHVTAKLNGSNCAYVFTDGKMYIKSRSGFRMKEDNIFWRGLTPEIEKFCTDNPNHMIYGEVIGSVKGYRYDVPQGQVSFRAFDIMRPDRTYIDSKEFRRLCVDNGIIAVPMVCHIPFNFESLLEIAELDCVLGNPIPEGIVVKPEHERRCYFGRVIAKIVSNRYLEKQK